MTQAKRPSQYGRKWNRKIPRYAIERVLGWTHVGTPWEDIERDLNARMDANEGYTPAIRKQVIEFAKLAWRENLSLYRRVMK